MIEAVTSVVSNAGFLRSSSEQQSTSTNNAVADIKVEKTSLAPQAPYISPFIAIDESYNEAVILIRDADTGDIVRQFPSESALKARQDADNLIGQSFQATTPQSAPSTINIAETGSNSSDVTIPSIDVANTAQSQLASTALSNAASIQTSEIAQASINVTA